MIAEGDTWRHSRITPKPINPDFQPIVLTDPEEGEVQVVAELVEVLGGYYDSAWMGSVFGQPLSNTSCLILPPFDPMI